MATDVNGTVVGIQGVAVSSTSPSDGQVLTYVTADSEWEPKTPGANTMYGYIYQSQTSFSEGTVNTAKQVPFASTGSTQNVTISSNNIEVNNAGTVRVTGVICFTAGAFGIGDSLNLMIYQNGGPTGGSSVGTALRDGNGQGSYGCMVVDVIVSCSANDTFGLYFRDASNGFGGDITASLILQSL